MGIWMMIENLIPIEPLTCVTGVFVEKLSGCRWLAHWQNPQWWCQASGGGWGGDGTEEEGIFGTDDGNQRYSKNISSFLKDEHVC